jgi:ATP-binding cassette subfamily C protein
VGTVWQARPLARRLAVVFESPPETGRGRADPGPLRGAVELSDVVFRYQADAAPVLDGLSVYAGPGEFLALVGRSGCGKSTVMRLLLGFEAAESGSVLYDDRDVGALDITAVRRQLGVVLQDTQLTPGTVLDNIGGGIGLTEEEAWAYAELAAFADDLRAMPMGMQTMVTPGAGAFSGGQRQRLLLARALARRPAVLLLDEATSALDNVTQGVVARNVAHLGITRIVVAHRLSTIASADRIAVIDAGRVAEQGTHDALMAGGGVYADLVARQVV